MIYVHYLFRKHCRFDACLSIYSLCFSVCALRHISPCVQHSHVHFTFSCHLPFYPDRMCCDFFFSVFSCRSKCHFKCMHYFAFHLMSPFLIVAPRRELALHNEFRLENYFDLFYSVCWHVCCAYIYCVVVFFFSFRFDALSLSL